MNSLLSNSRISIEMTTNILFYEPNMFISNRYCVFNIVKGLLRFAPLERLQVIPTCHILPPSEIGRGMFLAVLQAQEGNIYFTE